MSQIFFGFGGVTAETESGNFSAWLFSEVPRRMLDGRINLDGIEAWIHIDLRRLKPKLGEFKLSLGQVLLLGNWKYDGATFTFVSDSFALRDLGLSYPQLPAVVTEETDTQRREREKQSREIIAGYTQKVKDLIKRIFESAFSNSVQVSFWGETFKPAA